MVKAITGRRVYSQPGVVLLQSLDDELLIAHHVLDVCAIAPVKAIQVHICATLDESQHRQNTWMISKL